MTFDDLIFLKDVSQWPGGDNGRLCCLRRNVSGQIQHGFILDSNPLVVHTGNIWLGGDGDTLEYSSADAIVNDGWRVD